MEVLHVENCRCWALQPCQLQIPFCDCKTHLALCSLLTAQAHGLWPICLRIPEHLLLSAGVKETYLCRAARSPLRQLPGVVWERGGPVARKSLRRLRRSGGSRLGSAGSAGSLRLPAPDTKQCEHLRVSLSRNACIRLPHQRLGAMPLRCHEQEGPRLHRHRAKPFPAQITASCRLDRDMPVWRRPPRGRRATTAVHSSGERACHRPEPGNQGKTRTCIVRGHALGHAPQQNVQACPLPRVQRGPELLSRSWKWWWSS